METTKEQYDKEMEQIREDNLRSKGIDPKEDKELDEESKQIADEMEQAEKKTFDKNMGSEKIEVTREQYLESKKQQSEKQALKQLKVLQSQQVNHLKPEENKILQYVLANYELEKITHPVLIHLVKHKVELSKKYVEGQVAIKVLQQKLLEDIAKTTNNIVKCKGAIESADKQILDLIKEEPKILQ